MRKTGRTTTAITKSTMIATVVVVIMVALVLALLYESLPSSRMLPTILLQQIIKLAFWMQHSTVGLLQHSPSPHHVLEMQSSLGALQPDVGSDSHHECYSLRFESQGQRDYFRLSLQFLPLDFRKRSNAKCYFEPTISLVTRMSHSNLGVPTITQCNSTTGKQINQTLLAQAE